MANYIWQVPCAVQNVAERQKDRGRPAKEGDFGVACLGRTDVQWLTYTLWECIDSHIRKLPSHSWGPPLRGPNTFLSRPPTEGLSLHTGIGGNKLYSNLSRYFKQWTISLSSGFSQDFLVDLVKANSKLSTVEEFVSSVTPSCCCPNSRRKNMWHLSQASQTEVGQAALWLGHLGQTFGGFICKSGLRCTQIPGRTVWDEKSENCLKYC